MSLPEALDHAARGCKGMTFFNGRGEAYREIGYAELREEARFVARRLVALPTIQRGDRIALVAETRPEFAILFFACQYAGLVPVPMSATVSLGGRDKYVAQLAFLIRNSGAKAAFATEEFIELVAEAVEGQSLAYAGTLDQFKDQPASDAELVPSGADEVAYIQYTSGSTRIARGAVIKQRAVMCNLEVIIKDGLALTPADSFFSWLPFYHDMGLVGKLLVPVAGQVHANYVGTREFAMRPRLWLTLMDKTQATISFGPPFGYELCAKRLRGGDGAKYDLSHWRVAGVGAEMIRPDALESFVKAVKGSGFSRDAFLPCYGMAEVGLAISFSIRNRGVCVDYVNRDHCVSQRQATRLDATNHTGAPVREFVDCGVPLPGIELQVRDENGTPCDDRKIGTIWVRTASVMEGYLGQPEATREVLEDNGWLNTGDLGYVLDGHVFITGREKDIIIVGGKNFWPQDLEQVAERQSEVRTGGSMAFPMEDDDGREYAVLLVQCRERDADKRLQLKHRVQAQIKTEFSIDCHVELVDAHALPRTSSGKPSRSSAKRNYAVAKAANGNDDTVIIAAS